MKFEEFQAMTPFQQAVVLLLETIAKELEKISSVGE